MWSAWVFWTFETFSQSFFHLCLRGMNTLVAIEDAAGASDLCGSERLNLLYTPQNRSSYVSKLLS